MIPLGQFRQMAIIMAAGVLLDTVVVRSLLVPSLTPPRGTVGHRSLTSQGRTRVSG